MNSSLLENKKEAHIIQWTHIFSFRSIKVVFNLYFSNCIECLEMTSLAQSSTGDISGDERPGL